MIFLIHSLFMLNWLCFIPGFHKINNHHHLHYHHHGIFCNDNTELQALPSMFCNRKKKTGKSTPIMLVWLEHFCMFSRFGSTGRGQVTFLYYVGLDVLGYEERVLSRSRQQPVHSLRAWLAKRSHPSSGELITAPEVLAVAQSSPILLGYQALPSRISPGIHYGLITWGK